MCVCVCKGLNVCMCVCEGLNVCVWVRLCGCVRFMRACVRMNCVRANEGVGERQCVFSCIPHSIEKLPVRGPCTAPNSEIR